ncbi:MAG: DM13 domain-containing protein [Alphaproteobacteria bacterium]|nr:DM13 domain-containing protein [Alphaproteobacteria bacterium]
MNFTPHKKAAVRSIFVLLGLVACNAIWSLASPDVGNGWQASAANILQGEFTDGVGRYKGRGTAIVADADDGAFTVSFANFSVTRGPDLRVWLVAHPNPQNSRDVLESETMELGPLKARTGPQTYPIPTGTDFSKYQSLVIWCKAVNGLFSPVVLR